MYNLKTSTNRETWGIQTLKPEHDLWPHTSWPEQRSTLLSTQSTFVLWQMPSFANVFAFLCLSQEGWEICTHWKICVDLCVGVPVSMSNPLPHLFISISVQLLLCESTLHLSSRSSVPLWACSRVWLFSREGEKKKTVKLFPYKENLDKNVKFTGKCLQEEFDT